MGKIFLECKPSGIGDLYLCPLDSLQVAVGSFVLGHLGDQLCMVLEEKLNIDWLGVLLVAEEGDEDFESFG